MQHFDNSSAAHSSRGIVIVLFSKDLGDTASRLA